MGEYAVELDQVQNALTCIKEMIGAPDFSKHITDQAVDEKVPLVPITYSGIMKEKKEKKEKLKLTS